MKGKGSVAAFIILVFSLCSLSCSAKKTKTAEAAQDSIEKGKSYRIFIVTDTVDDWSSGIREGIVQGLDAALAAEGARASYEILDTKLDEKTAAGIKSRIEAENPDLVFALNYPSAFADRNISQKLKDPKYRFVSENPIAVESGTIASWDKPGGNVTGVSVFVQLNSTLRLAKKVLPGVKRVVSYSWESMAEMDDWWEGELRRACREEGFELAGFTRTRTIQEEIRIVSSPELLRREAIGLGCISAFVNEDGSPADANKILVPVIQSTGGYYLSYEDVTIRQGALMGTCVVWKDLGAQMAAKGLRILAGEPPGSIPWEYPRTFAIILNLKTAKRLGVSFPQEILDAAYRIYTDYDGNFMGKGD